MTIANNNYRLLIVDDNEAIHNDLKKILLPAETDADLAADEEFLFGVTSTAGVAFDIDSVFQGQDGLECVRQAKASGRPYALAFVDVRMPPGWDGVETIGHLWEADPDLQIVICTAHSDYNWHDISRRLGLSDSFVVLKKPFDIIEVIQLAHALTAKWTSLHQARMRMEDLDRVVAERTSELSATNARLKLLAAALEAAANSITVTDAKGNIVWTNPAFSALYGYSAEEVMGKNCSLLRSDVQDARFYKEMWDVISSGRTWRGEIVNRRKDGALIPEEMTITPVESQPGTITHFIAIKQDISERKLAQQRVNYLAYYDALTGLPNRMLLREHLNTAVAAARRRGRGVALLFLDLDRFKIINDSLGHSFGDLLLRQVASRLKNEIRQEDTVARVGGDEFLILLNNVENFAEVEVIATRIVKSVMGEFVIQGRTVSVTCSLGISVFPEHGEDAEALIKNADMAMYSAKEQGSNTFCFFTDEMNMVLMERLNLENGLRSAIDKGELFLVYQPQINIANGSVIGMEALIRWQSREWGLVMPDRFIRVAENSGLIVPIGEWVLRTACRQMKQWQDNGLLLAPIAVNVSAVQFRQEGFRELIKQVLDETGLDPQYLELELTESLLLSNEDVMFEVLNGLKSMGLKLAIDDFGTGYSSLSYLRQFPVTKLKIDRSFIREVELNLDDAAITAAIISMAKVLDLKVIAEGIENEAQLLFLMKHECDEGQGYFFSRPLNVQAVESFLRKVQMPMKAGSGSTVAA
jgi:diguanylate cyclase (GGDEF)-like protein/PAS domain S-box-containing protein